MEEKIPIDSKMYGRLNSAIAQGYLTASKSPKCFTENAPPVLKSGEGCIVTDTLGTKYFDFICGLGTNLLGYKNFDLVNAAYEGICRGLSLPLGTDLEILAAEKIKEVIPFIERVKFLKTGSEACLASLALARSYTGRHMVLTGGYHGWGSEFLSCTQTPLACPQTLDNGIPSSPFIRTFVDIDQINTDIAAVIIEPINIDFDHTRINFLHRLREKCDQTGTILIFDEVITGLRYKNFSVSNAYSVRPDLLIMGKAIGGGLPLSMLGGKKDIMDNPRYFVSSTNAGEMASLSVCIKTIELLQKKTFDIDRLWNFGEDFQREFNSLWPGVISIMGYPTRGVFYFQNEECKHLFYQETIKCGYLFGPTFMLNFCHMDHQYRILNDLKDLFLKLKFQKILLKGERPCLPMTLLNR